MPYIYFFLTLLGSYILIGMDLLGFNDLRLLVKTITSILFLLTALASYKKNPTEPTFFKLLFSGLFFSFLGDVFLGISHENSLFILGVGSFSLAHIMYTASYCFKTKLTLKNLIIFACFFIFTLSVILVANLDLNNMLPIIIIYALLITFMVAKSFSLLIYYKTNPFTTTCLITGSILFFISDMILFFAYFYPNAPEILGICNIFLYYLGQALIAISTSKGKLVIK